MANAGTALKRLFVGRPMGSGELEHTLLPKTIALPVFASDPLSSNAYATQEILLVLGLVGVYALDLVMPIAIAVAILLTTVVTSYRQTVRAYPSGGGAYRVSHENIGASAGLLAASALLIDYVLTVAVSITAGVDAILSAAPGLLSYEVAISFGFIAFVTVMNLRGVKESGTFFAIPTYGFVASVYLLLIVGFARCTGGCPQAESAPLQLEPEQALTFFLVLKAFAAGTTALTGVEAIADGVGAFRYPQSRNAAATLAIMAFLSISMFLGISWLADHTNVVFTEEAERTVVAQVAHTIFGGGPLFYLLQVMTAAILILAANTAYQDFPRLSSILAGDRYMPRQFLNRGDRLVFSNGVLILAVFASLLVYVFEGNLNSLIQLYLIGVFISFTLSQTGMVLRWRSVKEPGWKRRAAINGFGATVTGIVFVVIATTKFTGGAWMVLVAIPLVMYMMHSIRVHYDDVERQLMLPERKPQQRRPGNQHVVIFVTRVDAAAARAIGYVRSIRARDVSAATLDRANNGPWKAVAPEIPLFTLARSGSLATTLRAFLREKRTSLGPDDFLTVVIPEVLEGRGLLEILARPRMHRLKAALLNEPGVQVLDIPLVKEEILPGVDETFEPGRHDVVVLVKGVHNASLQAIEYAETLQPTDIRAVSFGLEAEANLSEKLGDDWLEAQIPHPLEIEASPFRNVGASLLHYVREFGADGISRIVTVVIPEFRVPKRRHQLLHGKNALVAKRHLLFEPGVVVVSVPYRLEQS